ncbi:hypothetical protein ACA910_018538 [Epithemia clementina (nom. ined.)]
MRTQKNLVMVSSVGHYHRAHNVNNQHHHRPAAAAAEGMAVVGKMRFLVLVMFGLCLLTAIVGVWQGHSSMLLSVPNAKNRQQSPDALSFLHLQDDEEDVDDIEQEQEDEEVQEAAKAKAKASTITATTAAKTEQASSTKQRRAGTTSSSLLQSIRRRRIYSNPQKSTTRTRTRSQRIQNNNNNPIEASTTAKRVAATRDPHPWSGHNRLDKAKPSPAAVAEAEAEEEEVVVEFIPLHHFRRLVDFFSATWWQSTPRFLQTFHPHMIQNVEWAVFGFIRNYTSQLRMTADWLDCSVEHLSKAWKITGFAGHDEGGAYLMFVDKLLNYTQRQLFVPSSITQKEGGSNLRPPKPENDRHSSSSFSSSSSSSRSSAMPETIALIAFMPYVSDTTRGQVLTTASLAATLMSLVRLECGRILIVVEQQQDHKNNMATASIMVATQQVLLQQQHQQQLGDENSRLIITHPTNTSTTTTRADNTPREALETWLGNNWRSVLSSASSSTTNSLDPKVLAAANVNATRRYEYRVGVTEIAVVTVLCSERDETQRHDNGLKMLPKAALLGIQKALIGNDSLHTQQWLGGGLDENNNNNTNNRKNQWKYIYLTEPDTILQARKQAMPELSRQLDLGNIVVPHRLQPIPHQRDLPNTDLARVVPANTPNANSAQQQQHVLELHEDDYKCCDNGFLAPGKEHHDPCGNFWWQCGFNKPFKTTKNTLETSSENSNNPNHNNNDAGSSTTNSQDATLLFKEVEENPHYRLSHYHFMELPQGTRINLQN